MYRARYISSSPKAGLLACQPRSIAVLGSTGSIGCSALDVLRLHPKRFRVTALACGNNIALLAKQASEFRPPYLAPLQVCDIKALQKLLPCGYSPVILAGREGYETLAKLPEAAMILSAQAGAAGLRGTFAAVEAGKMIALANKESLVLAGSLIRAACERSGASILPVDSEHNAIFQCLANMFWGTQPQAHNTLPDACSKAEHKTLPLSQRPLCRPAHAAIGRLILTASGGPFFGWNKMALAKVTAQQALAHPTWSMGQKITVDSATLMNKGLEIIEAHHLFGLPTHAIDVLVHREAVVHSLVEFTDGAHLAQLGQPDMKIPLSFCLGWPERLRTGTPRLNLAALGSLAFAKPDTENFPCLDLARQAQERGCGSPVVLNAANETAVKAFLEGHLSFSGIAALVKESLARYAAGMYTDHNNNRELDSIDAVLALDAEARARSAELTQKGI